jgi:hypothetical protein
MDANPRLTEVRTGMLQPNIILPSQYFGVRRRLTPEHGLMVAVLQDAIDCVVKHRHAKDYRGRRLFDEATRWLLAEETGWPYSFECICAALDLDANAVRGALRLPERQSAVVSREGKKASHEYGTVERPLTSKEENHDSTTVNYSLRSRMVGLDARCGA